MPAEIPQTAVFDAFRRIAKARSRNVLIHRVSESDKEFHFQDWVKDRLEETGLNYEQGGRNTYPDFGLVHIPEGYEVKGLAYPGRWLNFDSNSQVPTGLHNGRVIYYVFGRYPKVPDGDDYPLLDLVLCHGDFLNADHEYVHKNKSVKGFGSYGDILIRDRKMYVVPTPFSIATHLAHFCTLILPHHLTPDGDLERIGDLTRTETEQLVVGYTFDLRTNEIVPEHAVNPRAGQEHRFAAWRLQDEGGVRTVELAEAKNGDNLGEELADDE